jgi:hypothetical protein
VSASSASPDRGPAFPPEIEDDPIPGFFSPGDHDDCLDDLWWAEESWEDSLAVEDPWPAGEPLPEDPPPGVPEVFKAGRWDRSRGTGGGFAAGGVADHLPPGPVLAGLAGDRWATGLGRLADDELIGVMLAARRLASWATAMELAAVGDLWRRRVAEQDGGDTGAADHAADELAAALTLTGRAADTQLAFATALARLPLTRAALAAGDIDVPRAKVIADEVTGLTDDHAAAVEHAVIGRAPGQTTGQLRAAAQRAVKAADPEAARRRKDEAQREARVERWSEPSGTAALAGRDLPPVEVLAADQNLTALANDLKTAGVPGTLDTLRASVYLALLTGTPLTTLLPLEADGDHCHGSDRPGGNGRSDTELPGNGGWPGDRAPDRPGRDRPGRDSNDPTGSEGPDSGDRPTGFRAPAASTRGSINLTLPLATWLGLSQEPGDAAGHGPLDATDSRALADVLAACSGSRLCLTLTSPDGRPLAHGCSRAGPPPGRRRTRTRAGGGGGARDRPPTASRDDCVRSRDRTWTFTLTLLDTSDCDHAFQTPAYRPTPGLRHLVNTRQPTCVFPGCRRPAKQCDADHTVPYDQGGPTCLCNLAPLCRRHHQAKQTHGWALQQTTPGTMTWTTPSGRRYTVRYQ